MAKQCSVCGNKIGMWSSYTPINDGTICKACNPRVAKALNFYTPFSEMENLKLSHMSTNDILKKIKIYDESDHNVTVQGNDSTDEEFDINRAISADGLYADFTSKIAMRKLPFKQQKLYYFKDITGYTPNIDGHEVKKHHGVARAVTGGILFGGAGAIVGAVTGGKQYDVISNISITVFLSDGGSFENTILSTETKPDSLTFQGSKGQLDSWCNLLDRIINDNQSQISQSSNITQSSSADEIRKYKGLLDDGIITQEEFDHKKSELLNI